MIRRSTPIMDPSTTSLQEQTQVSMSVKKKELINKGITLSPAEFY